MGGSGEWGNEGSVSPELTRIVSSSSYSTLSLTHLGGLGPRTKEGEADLNLDQLLLQLFLIINDGALGGRLIVELPELQPQLKQLHYPRNHLIHFYLGS